MKFRSGIALVIISLLLIILFVFDGYHALYWSHPVVFISITIIAILSANIGSFLVGSNLGRDKGPSSLRIKALFGLGSIITLAGVFAGIATILGAFSIALDTGYWGSPYKPSYAGDYLVLGIQIIDLVFSVCIGIIGSGLLGYTSARIVPPKLQGPNNPLTSVGGYSLILGIVGINISFFLLRYPFGIFIEPSFSWVYAMVLPVLAILLGIIGLASTNKNLITKRLSVFGVTLSSITLVLGISWVGYSYWNYSPDRYHSTILRYDGRTWRSMDCDSKEDLSGVWGSPGAGFFAVGDNGTILRYDGSKWTNMDSGTTQNFSAIWGTSSSDVFAVGGKGLIQHFNGSTWSSMNSGTDKRPIGIWGSSSSDVFAVGAEGTILHYNGSSWNQMTSGTNVYLHRVWGSSSSDVFAVGDEGCILHYNGSAWSQVNTGTADLRDPWGQPSNLWGVWGISASNVFAAGESGIILHYDGINWSKMENSNRQDLWGIGGASASDIFAVAANGTILHFNGAVWSTIRGDASPGPLLHAISVISSSEAMAVGNIGR